MEKLLTAEELSKILRVEVHTIHVWTHSKRIPYLKAGHLLRFRWSDIEAWMQGKTTAKIAAQYKEEKPKAETKVKTGRRKKSHGQGSYIKAIVKGTIAEVIG
ncbi:MAG: helix-turn-helix domain-containing protein [Nitrospirota bacterium]